MTLLNWRDSQHSTRIYLQLSFGLLFQPLRIKGPTSKVLLGSPTSLTLKVNQNGGLTQQVFKLST